MNLELLKNHSPKQLLIFKNAHIIDPAQGIDSIGTLLVQDKKILAIELGQNYESMQNDAIVIDVSNKLICPGIVNLQNYIPKLTKESVKELGNEAAAAGITSLLIMPTAPQIIDNVILLEWLNYTAEQYSAVNLLPAAALTKEAKSELMNDYGLLKNAGAIALSDGQNTIGNSAIMRQLMLYARDFNLPILHQPQDKNLALHNGAPFEAAEGQLASWLGLTTSPKEAEIIGLERDLRLASMTQTRYHAMNISCNASCKALERAKSDNQNISAAASIAHLSFNQNDIGNFSTNYKYHPPLRAEEERQALVASLNNGTIDAISCAPNKLSKYSSPEIFSHAPFASMNLQSLLPLSLRLYHAEALPLSTIIAALTCNPAKILGINAGTLRREHSADFLIVDLYEPWQIEGRAVQGKVQASFVNGKLIFA